MPRRPIPRKGHTKSRRGCFNCKKRYHNDIQVFVLLKYPNQSTGGSNVTRDILSVTIVPRRDCNASIQQISFKQCNVFLLHRTLRRGATWDRRQASS